MKPLNDILISKAIIRRYSEKLTDPFRNDVVIEGAGPAGLGSIFLLPEQGLKVSLLKNSTLSELCLARS